MDLSKLSNEELLALKAGDYSKLSNEALQALASKPAKETSLGEKALNVLDYTGGLTRYGIGKLIEAGSDKDLKLPNLKDVLTLDASVPMTAEMMNEADVLKNSPITRNVLGFAGDVLLDPATIATLGAAGAAKAGFAKTAQGLTKAAKVADYANPAGKLIGAGVQKLGKPIYKAGMTNIDLEAAKYGKEPVSDFLFSQGVKGDAKAIQSQMDEIGQRLLAERDEILKNATKAGGEVSMKDAMAAAQSRVYDIRASKDPKLQGVADALQSEIDKYMKLEARAPEQILRELPTSKYTPGYTELDFIPPKENIVELPMQAKMSAVGSPVPRSEIGYFVEPGQYLPKKTIEGGYGPGKPETVLDWTEAVMGPTPIQGSQFKTTASLEIPQSAWKESGVMGSAYGAQKDLRGGLQRATEEAVGRSLGQEAQQKLIEKNYNLGQLLTTKDKQMAEVMREAKKPGFSSVDAMIAGAASTNPEQGLAMLGLKKAREALVRPRQTTNLGLFLDKYADTPAADALWRQILLAPTGQGER